MWAPFQCALVASIIVICSCKEDRPLPQSKRFLLAHGGLSSDQQTLIQEGFNVADDLATKINNKNFAGVIGKVAGAASKYLGAIGPFVGLVLSLFGSQADSPELQLLKRLFTQVESRFDNVDLQFDQLRRQLAFTPTLIAFNELESNINALQSEFITLSKVTNLAGYKYEANNYKTIFASTYQFSGTKLYNGIMHGGVLTGGIFQEFQKYSRNNRKETQHFMLGTLNLLMRAAALEMTYSEITNDPNVAQKRSTWNHHFNDVKTKMQKIDQNIEDTYHSQAVQDIRDFSANSSNGGLSNNDFGKRLYDTLSQKVYDTFKAFSNKLRNGVEAGIFGYRSWLFYQYKRNT